MEDIPDPRYPHHVSRPGSPSYSLFPTGSQPTRTPRFSNGPLTYEHRGPSSLRNSGISAAHDERSVPLMSSPASPRDPHLSEQWGVDEWKVVPTLDIRETKDVTNKAQLVGALQNWKLEIACCFLG